MSELEKRQRDQYQKRRKGWIIFQSVLAILLAVGAILCAVPYFILEQNSYVDYNEDGKASTKVYLNNNEFYVPNNGYESGYLETDHAYVAALVQNIETEFKYALKLDADKDVEYKYSYTIDAIVNVIDHDSKAPLYAPVVELVTPVKDAVSTTKELCITEKVAVNYATYNNIAKSFVGEYGISDASANLVLRMNVSVLGKCETLAADKNNSYTMDVTIPLLRQTLKISSASSVPAGTQRVLACDSEMKAVYFKLAIGLGGLFVLMLLVIIIYALATRDKHIDYARKVQRILSTYKSYIQRVRNPLEFKGYRILQVNSIEELLEIGDKLQIPVLMYENEDRTRAQFFVATGNNLLYLYEIAIAAFASSSAGMTKAKPVDNTTRCRKSDASHTEGLLSAATIATAAALTACAVLAVNKSRKK